MNTFTSILDVLKEAGAMGVNFQKRINYDAREYKGDGSVVTKADLEIEDFLCDRIAKLSPNTNFVTEERSREFIEGAERTFIIDPIDGTDNFSNGMHNWCISLGILDSELKPIGGIIYAPRLDFLIFAECNTTARLIGGNSLSCLPCVFELTKLSCIMMPSRAHRQLDIRTYPGKVRTYGSTALHLCMPSVYQSIIGAIQDDGVFAWDIAGAHAILSSLGCEIQYFNAKPIDYSRMKERDWQVEDFIVAGKQGVSKLLMKNIKKIPYHTVK